MEIKYVGHASFLIKTKNARIVTDPFESNYIGIKFPKTEADIVTVSHSHNDHNGSAQIGGNPIILDWPGEYEKLSVRVFGFPSFHDKTQGSERGENVMYKFEVEGISVLHCGDLGHIPDNDFIDNIGEVDILMVPVGGFYTIDATEAVALVKKIDPSIVLPMHYNAFDLKPEIFGQMTDINEFLKQNGVEAAEPIDKLVVKKEELVDDTTKIVVLSRTA